MTGEDPTGAYDDIVKLIKDGGYEFELAPPGSRHLGSANGVTVKRPGLQLVHVRDDLDGAQRIKTTVHDPLTAPTRPERGQPGPGAHSARRSSSTSRVPVPSCAQVVPRT
jgi:hypothetical protein